MDNANANPRRNAQEAQRAKSPATWIMAAVFFVALLGVLFLYTGKNDATSSSGANPPNVVTDSQPKK
jgi:preprotein translocase subunit SecG